MPWFLIVVFEQIGTSDQYDYKVIGSEFITVPGDETFMLFQVEACNDAHILLMQSNSTTDDIYEIVIGKWQLQCNNLLIHLIPHKGHAKAST